jgi:hypothetical protein
MQKIFYVRLNILICDDFADTLFHDFGHAARKCW